MATSGLNLATTKDGETYNKLSRPDNYLVTDQSSLPPVSSAPSPAMLSGKRKYEQDDACDTKRAKTDRNNARSKGRPRAHEQFREPCTRSVLPGLDGEEQLTDESIDEAVAYLRSVRSEASAIPTLLVAPNDVHGAGNEHRNDEDAGGSDYKHNGGTQRVVYNDGTWVALASEYDGASEHGGGGPDDLDPQESCQGAILRRFKVHRDNLTTAREHKSLPIKTHSSRKSKRAEQSGKHEWAAAIDRSYPALEEVLQIDEPTLYVALHGCALAIDRSTEISHQKSCWIWTLLALIGDFGTLDHERIGKIRDLGLAASRLVTRLCVDRQPDEQGIPGGKAEDNGASGSEGAELETTAHIKEGNNALNTDSGAETGEVEDGDAEDSGADMIMSDDEAEKTDTTSDGGLEKARARLLAQLGDRLVHSEAPPDQPPASGFHQLSRAEAERQRQEIRNNQPPKEAVARVSAPASKPTKARRTESEHTRLTDSELDTKAAIDMILTVVAECYGQRDLLKFRKAW